MGAVTELLTLMVLPMAPCVQVRFEVFIFEHVVVIAVRVVPVAVFHCAFEAVTFDPTNPFEMVRLEATNRLHATKLQKDP